jgi:hypothetical protein
VPQTIKAHFRQKENTLASDRIDDGAGIVYGCRVAELGKIACFEGSDGKPRLAKITPEFISALLSHAGNRSIPVHWTHDYTKSDNDALHAKVGALKAIRRDDAGNAIADLCLAPGEYRDKALWNATNDPTGMMLSPVFTYNKADPKSLPLDFSAADLVEQGAGVTALFSQATTQNQNKTMDIQELLEALKDPAVKTALT